MRQNTVLPRGLNRDHNPVLKDIFKGAAPTIIQQLPNEPLHHDHQQMLANKKDKDLAAVTLARKVATLTLSIWKNKEVYDPKKCRHTETMPAQESGIHISADCSELLDRSIQG